MTSTAKRHAVITGGGRGIGAAIARALAADGLAVSIGDLDAEAAAAVAASITANGGTAVGAALDVTDTPSYTAFLEVATAVHGPVDVLVSNAGVMWVGGFAEQGDGAAQRMLDVNVGGVMRGTRLVAPGMRARGSGQLVTIASLASKLGPVGMAGYAASKHAVYGYCSSVRRELAGTGVKVTVVMPSVVSTDLAVGVEEGMVRRLTPEDVARAVVGVVRRPRAEVTIPRYVGALARVVGVLPVALREQVELRVLPDERKVTDVAARAAYEARALGQSSLGQSARG